MDVGWQKIWIDLNGGMTSWNICHDIDIMCDKVKGGELRSSQVVGLIIVLERMGLLKERE